MAGTPDQLEARLAAELGGLGDRFADEAFSAELYRALAGCALEREDTDGRVSLSWGRAEAVVNEQRLRAGQAPLELAQTGGEGEVSPVVADELARLGWRAEPRPARGEHDPDHVARPESPPPPDHGERMAPVGDSPAWEREAHEEAERERRAR